MEFTDKQVIERLTTAAQLAEATFLKIKPVKLEERIIVIDAIEELGKALAVAELRKFVFFAMVPLLFSVIGCQKVDRLLNGPKEEPAAPVQAISSAPAIGEAPEFNIQTPAGYTRQVFHGELIGTVVNVSPAPDSLVRVFIKERVLGQWFAINDSYSDAFWYTFDPVAGTVTYHGQNLGLKEFCVYQYVEAQP